MIDEKKIVEKGGNVTEDNDDASNDEEEQDPHNICNRKITMFEFKRIVCEQLVSPFLKDKKSKTKVRCENVDEYDGSYILLPNKNINRSDRVTCCLCTLLYGKENPRTARYGCVTCGKGFHVECFAAYHHKDKLTGKTKHLKHVIETLEDSSKSKDLFSRKRKSDKISTMEDMKLPG